MFDFAEWLVGGGGRADRDGHHVRAGDGARVQVDGEAVLGEPAARCRGVRRGVRGLPAGPRVHRLGRRPHHHDQRLRGRTGPARAAQADPAWVADYRATRPKVERKIGHLMRRRHGGRRARVRGTTKVAADFSLLAAAVNLARLGALGLRRATGQGWQVAPA